MTGQQKKLTTPRIVFLVVAAAAPLAAMVGNVPLALKLGNGPGLPGAFVVATVVLLCFATGYAAMSRKVVNTGAFYTYVARGLGKPPAVAVALLAVLSYNALAAGLAGAFGYFGSLVLASVGVDVSWIVVAFVGWALTAFLGYRSVDVSAKVLAFLMSAEVLILLVLDFGVIGHKGSAALPLSVFSPSTVFSGALGLALMFAFASFIGFESAALYGEESENPERNIPRATYASVLVIGVLYTFTTWCIVGAGGVEVAKSASKDDLGEVVLNLARDFAGGDTAHDVMAVFFVTSVLASLLAIHNAASRYMFALGREHLLPSALGTFHPRRYSPYIASMTQSAISFVVVAAFALSGLDPYLNLAASMVGLSTLGIVLLQAVAAVSIIAFFARRTDGDWWRTVLAPLIGGAGLVGAAVLITVNYSTLTGTGSPWVNWLPLLLVVVACGGVLYAFWLRRNRPEVYRQLAQTSLRRSGSRTASVHDYGDDVRYCIVGGGPAGLVMARAFDAEGIGYDLFERHEALGGIWDTTNPGTPMYSSAHFISSKYTSGFFGYPMPDDYPDYPTHKQVLAYIRAFADAYGLTARARTGTAVVSAEPMNGGWQVTLSTGEVRSYTGVVCANGVTWHPSMPDYPGMAAFQGEVRHSSTYVSPDELRGRRVLIVGAGNSGVDIACDAARAADQAFLSVRRGYRFVPKHLFGVPTDVFISQGVMPPDGVVVPEDPTALVDALVGDLTRYGLPAPDHALLASHPIMNTQVLHHLAHGDLAAKPDVRSFGAHSVVFADGSEEEIDLVLLATGYDYLVPYVDPALFTWNQGRPDLYLNVLHRSLDGLYVLGFIELADAAYRRFDEMAGLVVMDAHAHATGEGLAELTRLRAEDHPDLRGGHEYVSSPRHAAYVDAATYVAYLAQLRDRFGFPDPDDSSYPLPVAAPPVVDVRVSPDVRAASRP